MRLLVMSELCHYGVLGMKWGIRRYQNYDGSYTKKGMERYRKSEKEYNDAKDKLKAKKANRKANREDIANAKYETKTAKQKLNEAYDQLKRDNLSDQGKKLHDEGAKINDGREHYANAALIAVGTGIISHILIEHGYETASYFVEVFGAADAITEVALGLKDDMDAKRLNSYYERVNDKKGKR